MSWSHGEVTKPETINYRTQRAEKDGLFCEKIFGPEKDYECYCGKYKRIRYKNVICDRCGVEVTKSSVRRERMGHIKLACPVSHIWFLRGIPSRMGMILDVPMQQLERIIYFAAYIVTDVDEEAKKGALKTVDKEYKQQIESKKSKLKGNKKELAEALQELKDARGRAREEIAEIKPLGIFSEVAYYNFSLKYGELFEAGTGAETLRKVFEKIDLKKVVASLKRETEKASSLMKRKILRRLRLAEGMIKARIKPEWMFSTVIPILPPDLRPMVQLDGGRYASSDLNDLYRRVINRNNRLRYLLEIDAPEVIVRNEKRMLQEAVDALIDNGMRKGVLTTATTGGRRLLKSLADILKGKQGRFRQNLLGKRVDYSGRSVIVVGPKLKLHQCGLPKKMALELFKPFVIKNILDRELAYNVRGASRLIEQETDEVWEILEEVVKDRLVLLNRAPTLHKLGIQAFQPVLIEGESIRVHPLVCKAFNADFDGDQMAVHVPLSERAQKEAREIMLSVHNLLKPATGVPIVSPSQDIILGCYWLTKIREGFAGEGKIFASLQEAIFFADLGEINMRARIRVRMPEESGFTETSVGRILFNETLPKNYPFVNECINSRKLEKIVGNIIEQYDQLTVEDTLDKVKNLGFEGATLSGITWGMDDLIVPAEKGSIIKQAEQEIDIIENHFKRGLLSKEEKSSKVIEVWTRAKLEIEKRVPETLPKNGPIFTIVDAGARGSWTQPVQMAGMKGLVINPAGQIIEMPVKSSFKEGFNVLEYFISTHGARKGTADTALRTSTAGYLTRRLIDVAHDVAIFQKDCKDQKGFLVYKQVADELGQNFVFKIVGRIAAENIKDQSKVIVKKGEMINWGSAQRISDGEVKKVRVRSPITCISIRGICQKCYGWNLSTNAPVALGQAVGIVAAQAIGEPGTQLTMRTFHTGGVAGGGDITFGLPRVQEVFEARVPGGGAEIARVDGIVVGITQENIIKVRITGDREENTTKKKSIQWSSSKDKGTDDVVEYKIPAKTAILVQQGQKVKKGQQLCEGHIDLKELFKTTGAEQTQRYILQEIQKIYVSQGVVIHDKHIEVIVRQMFSRVKIKDSGDTSFTKEEVVEKSRFLEANVDLKKEKKLTATATEVLLGISQVSLTTDSFLSAASFQETSRVLIQACLEGKEDTLRGLKENVIIGKLIPFGTGFKK